MRRKEQKALVGSEAELKTTAVVVTGPFSGTERISAAISLFFFLE
jgi:hypothetical protein